MINFKRKFLIPFARVSAIISVSAISSIVFITSCSVVTSKTLHDEINRLNTLSLKPKSDSISQNEFNNINEKTLSSYISDYEKDIKKDGFTTTIVNIEKSSKIIKFNLEVKEISTNQVLKTNQLQIEFSNITPSSTDLPEVPANANGWSQITNTDPSSANQYNIDHANKYHFNRPEYKDGKVTLKQDGSAANNVTGDNTPSSSSQYAQEGYIPTQTHANLSKRVFSVGFQNSPNDEQTGTAWILDYKTTEDNSYPTKWFFATNSHVIDDLKVANEPIYKEKFSIWKDGKYLSQNTRAINFWSLKNAQSDTFYKDNWDQANAWKETSIDLIDRSKEDNNWKQQDGFYVNKDQKVKTIFQGFDFLSTSPKQFSAINAWKDKEEYADFGVFEINFDTPEEARKATNDYANWKEEDKFKYRESDFVSSPETKPNRLYVLGYPKSTGNFYRNVATNTNHFLYEKGENDQNNGLTNSPNYSTWTHINGAFDAHIAMSDFTYSYDWVDNTKTGEGHKQQTPYVTYGLIYGTKNGNMKGGSSGSLVIDDKGYAIGIHYASDNNASMGGVQAFYSQGYNYNGYYGNYNLEQYDLIRGGGRYQKSSYYDNLVKIYGADSNFKTHIFKNGLSSRH